METEIVTSAKNTSVMASFPGEGRDWHSKLFCHQERLTLWLKVNAKLHKSKALKVGKKKEKNLQAQKGVKIWNVELSFFLCLC